MTRQILVGSRGSALARAQAQQVIAGLHERFPEIGFRLEIIRTQGDRLMEREPPATDGKGLFVKEIEEALREEKIDLAVHSLKDLPTEQPDDLLLAAIPKRGDPRDVLVSRGGLTLSQLPHGARVGTASPRRAAQLLACRPDLQVVSARGNVDTRLHKIDKGAFDALALAAAGLIRLGLADRISEYLSPEPVLPAVGQGALAIEVRRCDERTTQLVRVLEDEPTHLAITAERAVLRALGGGCRVPIAAYGHVRLRDERPIALELQAVVASPDGRRLLRGRLSGDPHQAEALGQQLAKNLLRQGAEEILHASA
jgi:hydroxymethylbilane synthase